MVCLLLGLTLQHLGTAKILENIERGICIFLSAKMKGVLMYKFADYIRITIALSFVFYISINIVHAANISFTGSIVIVDIDNGAGVYAGTTIGDTFSGNIIVGNSVSEASSTGGGSNSFEYTFSNAPYGIVIGNGAVEVSSSFTIVAIDNNYPSDAEGAAEINNIFGINLQPGSELDAWAAFGHTDNAIVDVNDNLSNGLEFGIIYGFNPSTYAGLDYQAAPPTLANVDYPYFYISESDASGNQIFNAVGILDGSEQVPAEVSSVSIWLNRTRDLSSNSTSAAFYTDVHGTISEFKTIILTSPLNNTYNLGLSPEGDQWGSGIEGAQSVIEAEFPDGTYTFNVTYADDSTEEITVELGGDFPPYPENIALSNTQATWDAWTSPAPLSDIEVQISENNGSHIVGDTNLAATNTSFSFLDNLMIDTQSYDLSVWFVTEVQESAFKASITKITTPAPEAGDDSNSDGGGGGTVDVQLLQLLFVIMIVNLLRKTRKVARRSD